jgi:alpha-L-arabinofuranosidase
MGCGFGCRFDTLLSMSAQNLSRRRFLHTAAAFAAPLAMRGQAPAARIEVLANEPIATIAPEIYGHFVEHLGAVVYDGIWVGNSKIPNVQGIRKALVDALRPIRPSVIRWPGGCFADQYDWRDGTGPHKARPQRTNFWVDSREWSKEARKDGPEVFDPNHFGTVEFVRFCRQVGAEPYLAANLRSLPAQDFWRWVEYCNAPAGSTTLARLRAADGEPAPLNVRYWGIGNESWGCGGNFNADEYAVEFRRFTAWVPSYGVQLALIGSGPNGNDREWTRRFFDKAGRSGLGKLWGWGAHHYSWNVSGGRTRDWYDGKGDALKFEEEQYYELLHEGDLMDTLIQSQWGVMSENDPQHRVKLAVDEWGAWHKPGTEPFPEALLGQQNTMRDAVLAGLSFDIFHRHADKVAMTNIAQLVNCLQSLFFAHEDKFAVTPTYHVFAMYADHQGAQSLRTEVAAPSVSYTRNGRPASLRSLSSSASMKDGRLTVTVNNLHMNQPVTADLIVRGASLGAAEVVTLAANDPRAHNNFAQPNAVQPRPVSGISAKGGVVTHTYPPASVTKLRFQVGRA